MARPAWPPPTTATSKTSDSLGSPPCSMVVVALAGLKFVMMSTPSSLAAGSPGGRVLVRARGWQPAAGLAPAKSPGPAENVEVSGVTPDGHGRCHAQLGVRRGTTRFKPRRRL